MVNRKWLVNDLPPEDYCRLFPGQDPIITNLLYQIGIKNQIQAREFLSPDFSKLHDPFLFNHMGLAVDRILRALEENELIMIHGDYDADGVTSSAIVFNVLESLGANVQTFIPHREQDGYGLNIKNIEKFIAQHVKLLITVDCGTSNVEEIKAAVNHGIDVIVTDHHEPPPELPPALAIINPKIAGEQYPFKDLSGVGMAYKLVSALLRQYQGSLKVFNSLGGVEGYLKWILDIVAIGLVADIVPLVGENRILVKYGLLVLGKTRRPGLRQLAALAGIDINKADTHTIGYQIAPRINAAGRLSHAREAFDLLTVNDPGIAAKLAFELNEINARRQKLTEQAMVEARAQIQDQAGQDILFVYHESWAAGVIGLVAGRLCEENGKPCMAMTGAAEQVVGSGRSLHYLNITDSLYQTEKLLLRFGGHHQACGFTIEKKEYLSEFKEKIALYVSEKVQGQDLTPIIHAAAKIRLEQINIQLVKLLETFQPYGEGNPKPKFWLADLQITAIDFMGEDGKHLKIMAKHPDSPAVGKLLGFNLGPVWGKFLAIGDIMEALVELGVNVWRERESVEMKIVDLKKMERVG